MKNKVTVVLDKGDYDVKFEGMWTKKMVDAAYVIMCKGLVANNLKARIKGEKEEKGE